ncbi:putative Ubiquitin domain-containing protein [Helianthus annuus]|nr:putative Ubiquitin domain-containing protein [Helianthus annuus]KAJ0508050.1 putative Ubiquitin domain-containing protein [Helianthus annuus]KAJ0516388.1 putative Ubiquitin domain-containing protein [Helianthus annuus]KAJ0684392.1 putative Ubiquitin domain-containing protein [Helianthus annuus]KAJ0688335.1 putative Ubiquitin domain-containing protein [Helianthus annuus]
MQKEIWDAIHAAAEEADIELAQTILDSAGVIVHKPDMTVCYDETGNQPYASLVCTVQPHYLQTPLTLYFIIFAGTKYKIPRYVLSEPTNLIQLS